jgi:hypothetical protein
MSDTPPIVVHLKWWQDDDGDTSFMRIGAMVALILGGMIVLTGLTLAVHEVITQPKTVVAGVALVGIGSGMITGTLASKALQRRAEAQIAAAAGR